MSAPARVAGRTYFAHVEGLRGVAAGYVFIFHMWQTAIQHPATATLASWLFATQILQYGHFAVPVFIVISGYCLGMPVAQRLASPFDVKRFFVRRARRLMPAYVAVVFLSVIPFALTAIVSGKHVNVPHIIAAVALHLALIHNLSFATTEYLNGPLWSIALECQIYVVFALLLVPVWRRFGPLAQFGLALILGFLPQLLFHSFDWTVPWMVALFAMGVVAADLGARASLPRWPWNSIAIAAAVIAALTLAPFNDALSHDVGLWPPDLAVGAAVALFFVAAQRNERMLPARALALGPVVFLGTFSYSLYLVHAPLIDLVGALLVRAHAGIAVSAVVWGAMIVGVPVLAYGLFLALERPFLTPSFKAALRIGATTGTERVPVILEDVAPPATALPISHPTLEAPSPISR